MSNKLKRFESCDIADQRGVGGNSTFCLINSYFAYLKPMYSLHIKTTTTRCSILNSYYSRMRPDSPPLRQPLVQSLIPVANKIVPYLLIFFFYLLLYNILHIL